MKFLIVLIGLIPLIAQEPAKPAPDPAPQAEAQKPEEKKAEEAKPEEAKTEEKAAAQTPTATPDRIFSGSIDFGYRWRSDVAGNLDAYRTAVNLGEGPKLFNADLSLVNPNGKLYDKIMLFGTNWGGEPNSATRLDMGKQRIYDFHFDYRNIAYYNFLPSFANPRIDSGQFQTQRGYDIRRRMIDAELRLRPGTRIIPYIAYTRNWGDGRGVTNFVTSGNEYPVFTRLDDKTDQYRAGVNLEFSKFHVTLEQGGTTYDDNQDVSTNDRNDGNRTTPILGQRLFLTNLRQSYLVSGDSLFERAIVTATPFSWIDISGQFLYSRPKTDTTYNQTAQGNFVNLATLQFFNSNREFVTSNASQPHTSGVLNLEIRPLRRVRILESLTTDRFHTASSSAFSDLTVTQQATPLASVDRLAVNYNRQQVQANIDVLRWLTVRAGHRYVWGDAEVRVPEIFTTPQQRGELGQQVGLFGLQLRFGQKLWVNGDSEIAKSDRVYFRTSLADYRKGVVRARYQLLNSLSFTGNFVALNNENPNPAVRFDMKSYLTSAGFLWNPGGGKRVSLLGDYTRSTINTTLGYLQPQALVPDVSEYRENGHTGTALLDINSPGSLKYAPRLTVGGSFFKSAGSRPTSYYTPLVKLGVPLHEHANLFAEWRHYGLSETLYSYEGFRAHTFVIGLRLIR